MASNYYIHETRRVRVDKCEAVWEKLRAIAAYGDREEEKLRDVR